MEEVVEKLKVELSKNRILGRQNPELLSSPSLKKKNILASNPISSEFAVFTPDNRLLWFHPIIEGKFSSDEINLPSSINKNDLQLISMKFSPSGKQLLLVGTYEICLILLTKLSSSHNNKFENSIEKNTSESASKKKEPFLCWTLGKKI